MNFNEFTGNHRIVEYFRKALQNNRLAHAYLFSGPAGVGKATLARLICRTVLCKKPGENGPCNECASCLKMDSGNHSDFHVYASEGLYFKIDQVRLIIHEAALKPVESAWKTFLLQDVDFMREEAANAFLKVLEEPPGQTLFFLVCERVEALLPTIRSRCQRFDFQPLRTEEVKAWLVTNRGMDEQEASHLSRYTRGSIGAALSVNSDQYKEIRDKVLLVLEAALLPKSYMILIDSIRAITVERTEMQERFLLLEELTRDLLLLKASPKVKLAHEDVRSRLNAMVQVERYALQKFYEDLLMTREAVLKINANISLSLQALLLSLRLQAAGLQRISV